MAELHATLSPSSADRWMTCPGSVPMSEGIGDTSSEYADEGTAAHEIAALCLTEGTDAAAYVGRVVEVNKGPRANLIEVTADMAEHIQVYVDYVRGRVEAHQLAGGTVTLEVEQRVPIGHLTLEPGAEGTADTVLIAELPTGVLLEVIDLKFGRGVEVDATDNRQLRLYALGALEKFGMVWNFTDARVVISQPRISRTAAEWDLTIEDLQAFGKTVKEAAHGVRAATICWKEKTGDFEDKYLNPSDDACRWCKVKGSCNKAAQHVATTLLDDFEDLSQEGVEQATKTLGLATDARLALCLATVDFIQDWCTAVREEGYRRLLAAGNKPELIEALGVKLVEGREGNREWADEAEAEKALKAMRLRDDVMYSRKLITPTAVADLAPSYDKAGKVKPPKEGQPKPVIGDRQWKKLQSLIVRKPASLKMVPKGAKGAPATIKTAAPDASEFENLEAGPFFWHHPESDSFGQVDTRTELDELLTDPNVVELTEAQFNEVVERSAEALA